MLLIDHIQCCTTFFIRHALDFIKQNYQNNFLFFNCDNKFNIFLDFNLQLHVEPEMIFLQNTHKNMYTLTHLKQEQGHMCLDLLQGIYIFMHFKGRYRFIYSYLWVY